MKEKQILMQAGTNVIIINMGAFEFDMGKVDERKYIWGSSKGKEQQWWKQKLRWYQEKEETY